MFSSFDFERSVAFTRMDALMLAAILDGRGKPTSLRPLIERMDWLGRVVPTFEELSYGANRLKSSGLIAVNVSPADEATFAPTDVARELWRSVRGQDGRRLVESLTEALGAAPYPADEQPDRSLGPLAGFTLEAVTEAVRAHAERTQSSGKGLASVVRRLGSFMGWDKPPR